MTVSTSGNFLSIISFNIISLSFSPSRMPGTLRKSPQDFLLLFPCLLISHIFHLFSLPCMFPTTSSPLSPSSHNVSSKVFNLLFNSSIKFVFMITISFIKVCSFLIYHLFIACLIFIPVIPLFSPSCFKHTSFISAL